MALGTISPVILRAALEDPATDGRIAGRIYAAGTIGAVLGSLLAGYALLPWMGAPLLVVALALVLALCGRVAHGRIEVPWLVTLLAIGVVIAGPIDTVAQWGRKLGLRPPADTHVVDSRYFHIAVSPHDDRWVVVPEPDQLEERLPLPTFDGRLHYDAPRLHWRGAMSADERDAVARALGGANAGAAADLLARTRARMRRLTLDGFVHGYAALDEDRWLEYDYETMYAGIVDALYPTERDVSMRCFFIGGGCYTFQQYLLRQRKQIEIVSAELDPEVTAVAGEHLGLKPDARHVIRHDDARAVLRRDETKYDVVFGDAFHDLAVPWHLTTKEFAQTVRARLDPSGVYLINMIDVFDSGRFLRAYVDTLREVFPHVQVLSMMPRQDDQQNTFLIMASMREQVWRDPRDAYGRPISVVVYDGASMQELRRRTEAIILRDDFAPVEHLLAPVVKQRGAIDRSR